MEGAHLNVFSELVDTVAAYLHRQDVTPRIPTFIQLAEARFNRELRTAEQEKTAYHTVADNFVILPDDFLELRGLYVDGKLAVYETPEQMQILLDCGYVTNQPTYTIQDRQFRLLSGGSSTQTKRVEALYFSYVPALTAINPANWLLTKHPDAYLYLTLAESRGFIADDERTAIWGARANEAMAGIRRASDAMLYGPNMVVKVA